MPRWPRHASERFVGKSRNDRRGDAVEEPAWSTGQIMAKLNELGIDNDTFASFMFDNGGETIHEANNCLMRSCQGRVWEGERRVCFVARWPGRIPVGTASGALAVAVDIRPIFAALAGGSVPTDRIIDAEEIRPLPLSKAREPTKKRKLGRSAPVIDTPVGGLDDGSKHSLKPGPTNDSSGVCQT